MIKFTAKTTDGKTLIGMGLSEANIQKLKEGLPIFFSGEDLGADNFEFTIMYGETEMAIRKELSSLFGKETQEAIGGKRIQPDTSI